MKKAICILVCCWCLLPLKVSAQPQQINLKKIDQFLEQNFRKSCIPGMAVAIVTKDSILFSKGYGNMATHQPVDGNTPFAIASLSKAFTALAVMQLAEAGKIKLKAPVVQYLPDFKLADDRGKQITVEHLLYQTSGLSDRVFPEMKLNAFNSWQAFMEKLQTVYIATEPGQQFKYHNPNYLLLARLVEVVSGERFSAYLEKHIFGPLHMNHTWQVNHTREFYAQPGRILVPGHILLPGKAMIVQELDWWVSGSAGMVSTVNDMAQWLRLQLNQGELAGTRLLSSKGMDILHTPPADISSAYGMGWVELQNKKLYHDGMLWTFKSEQMLLKNQGYGIVILFNSGITVFEDYYSFIDGVTALLNNKPAAPALLPSGVYYFLNGILIIVTIVFGIRRLLQTKWWEKKYRQHSKWKTWFSLLLQLLPLIVFLLLPTLITESFGRVLSWERIFLMMPGIMVWLGLWAIFNVLLVGKRISIVFRKRDSNRLTADQLKTSQCY